MDDDQTEGKNQHPACIIHTLVFSASAAQPFVFYNYLTTPSTGMIFPVFIFEHVFCTIVVTRGRKKEK